MAVSKAKKEANANKPGQHIGQSQDQVFDTDANPPKDNLASRGEKIKSGRQLPSETNDSAPKVKR